MNILVLHGPNLNLLGIRPGDDRGRTFESLERAIRARADSLQISVRTALAQSEGGMLEALHRERAWAEGIVVNPTSLARTAWSLREALWAVGKPAVEVQLEEGPKGEPSRRESVLRDVCVRQIFGEGMDGYLRALEHLASGTHTKSIGRGSGSHPIPSTRASGSHPVPSTRASGSHAALSATRGSGSHPALTTPTVEIPRKTIGRRAVTEAEIPVGKSIGRRARTLVEAEVPGRLSREAVRRRITERLAGRISPAELAEWAKGEWQQLQRGGDFEDRGQLEDALQRLLLSNVGPSKMSDDQLLELLTGLGE